MMTVKELIEELKKFPPEWYVKSWDWMDIDFIHEEDDGTAKFLIIE